MKKKHVIFDDEANINNNYIDDDDDRRKFPSFILLCLIVTFGVLLALGLSFSAIQFIDSNETINALISSLVGREDKDSSIITYVENTSIDRVTRLGTLHISDAKYEKSTNGGSGEVVYYSGLLLKTKNTFQSKASTITYKVTLTNNSSKDAAFNKLIYNRKGDIKYTLTGIKKGDVVAVGESVVVYLTAEYNGDDNIKFPTTIDSYVDFDFTKESTLHISDAKYDKSTNGGSGEVVQYEGLFLETKNTFTSKSSTITYKVTLTNDSDKIETFNKLIYDPDGDVKYSVVGIKPGDTVAPGESKVVELVVEYVGDDNIKFPTTIDSYVDFDFTKKSGELHISNAKYDKSTNGGSGEVVQYEGLFLETKNTFTSKSSTITYKVTLTNDSSQPETFNTLIYNVDGDVKYRVVGIKPGDTVAPGESKTVELVVEYVGDDDIQFPTTIDSYVEFDFTNNSGILHISDAKYDKSTNGGSGEVVYYEGLFLETKNTFTSKSSTITYKVTLTNDSSQTEIYDKLIYDPDGDIKYSVVGIKPGDTIVPGESKVVELVVEYTGDDTNFPVTIDSAVIFDFQNEDDTDIKVINGINLINQFPTKDEVGKQFEGENHTFDFTLIIGSKTLGAYYEITAVPIAGNTLSENYVKLYLEKNGTGVDMSYRNNGRVKNFSEYNQSNHQEAEGKVIYSGYITEEDILNRKIVFKLRMWVSEDVIITENNMNDYNNKRFGVRVNTYATFER